MNKKQVYKILDEVENIEVWEGQAYIPPCEECPEGDEVYQALMEIKDIALEELHTQTKRRDLAVLSIVIVTYFTVKLLELFFGAG